MSLGIEETTGKIKAGQAGRLGGVDAARAVAVLGMVMVHFGPNPTPETLSGDLYGVSHGRASILFVLLAGVGVALLAGRGTGDGPRWSARGRLLFRAALLLPLGLWLEGLEHDVAVILQFYALYFVLAAIVLSLPDLLLLVLGALVLLGGPVLYLTVEAAHPAWFDLYPAALGDPVGRISRDLLISGSYPLAVWSAPLLFGIWLGRRNLHAPTARWQLLGIGLAVAVATPFISDWLATAVGPSGPDFDRLATSEPHGQMPLWMTGSIGSACAVLGGALLLVDRFPRATWPLVATGQLALSVYVGHILLLTAYPDLLIRDQVPAAAVAVGLFVLLAAAVCALWRALLPRGPLEAVFAAPGWAARRIVRLRADRARGTPQGTGREAADGGQESSSWVPRMSSYDPGSTREDEV